MRNRFLSFFFTLLFLPVIFACTDLSGIESDIEKLSVRVSTLDDAISAFKKACDAGKFVSNVQQTTNKKGWVLTFADNSTITLLDASNKESLVSTVVRDDEKGKIIITMQDGTAFSFDIDLPYPTGLISTVDTVFISPKGVATFSIILNPSNAYVNTNISDAKCSFNLKNMSSKSGNLKLSKIEVATDANGNSKDGMYDVTISDYGIAKGASENFELLVRSKSSNGDSVVVSSGVITVVSVDALQNFSIGGIQGDDMNGLFYIHLPEDIDVKKLKPTFESNGKVYVNGIQQISGVSEQDFTYPVQYTAVGKDGVETKFIVVVANGNSAIVNITSPPPSIEEFKDGVTINILNTSSDKTFKNAKIKGFDNLSWTLPKKNYEVRLESAQEFLGLEQNTSFAFYANHSDKTLLRNYLAFKANRNIFKNIKWAPSYVYAHVILNGEYIGFYLIAETVRIGKNRINILNLKDCKLLTSAANYGFLLEVNDRKDKSFNFTTKKGVNFSLVDPDGASLSKEYKQYIEDWMQKCENALFASDFNATSSGNYLWNYFDINSFADWFIINEISKNSNAKFHLECYMYFDPSDKKMHMGPVGDSSIAFGNVNFLETELYYNWWLNQNEWIKRMLSDKTFMKTIRARWITTKSSVDNWASTQIQTKADALSPDAKLNFSKWPILGKYVWPNASGFEKRTTYQSEVDHLKQWINNRITWMDSEIHSW